MHLSSLFFFCNWHKNRIFSRYMTTLNKLDTFILRDQFNWSRQQILAEANFMAIQHAEIMGWKSVEIKDVTAIPTNEDQYVCYKFEIWGIGTPIIQEDAETSSRNIIQQTPSHAAKQPEL